MSHALLTDHYELTMLDASLHDGSAERTCVFQVFCRSLPPGRRFAVAMGLGRLVPMLAELRFTDEDVAFLREHDIVSADTADWLGDYRFTGDVWGYPEGELFFADSPILQVIGSFAESVVLETLVLSVLNHDAAIAAAAARMREAAGDRSLLEFGSRRTHEKSAIAAARAAWMAGFDATSNLAAGLRHGVPTLGTAAHAWTLLHDEEIDAFATQVAAHGPGTTLLVDTYDTERGIARALDAAGTELGGIRIDSGDLGEWARRARRQLDDAGATDTRIVVSGDLEEHAIAELADAPIDGYGVGTQLVVGSDAPTASLVYKLVARSADPGGPPDVAVAKSSGDKATVPGRMRATRVLHDDGTATTELLTPWDEPAPDGRPLQVEVMRGGEVVHTAGREEVLGRLRASLDELPADARDIHPGDPAVTTEHRGASRPS